MTSVSSTDVIRHPYVSVNLNITMTISDGYSGGTLGCHIGMLGSFSVEVTPVRVGGGAAPMYAVDEHQNCKLSAMTHPLTPYVIVNWLQDQLSKGYAHFGGNAKKSHIIISANENSYDYYLFGTTDIIEMIVAMCKEMPEKFGTATITETTNNMAAGHISSRVRTLVWVPGYVTKKLEPKKTRQYWKLSDGFRSAAQAEKFIPLTPMPVVDPPK